MRAGSLSMAPQISTIWLVITHGHTHTHIIKSTHTQSSLELDKGVNSNYNEAEPAHIFETLEGSKLTCMPKKDTQGQSKVVVFV